MFARLAAATMLSAAVLAFTPAYAAQEKKVTDANQVSTDIAVAPAGEYVLEKSHASIAFKVRHMGFADYLMRFNDFDATITLDPKALEKSTVNATVQVGSFDSNNPKLLEHVSKKDFFDLPNFPSITFTSTKIEKTGVNTGKITGDLTLLGVKKPVVLDTTFIGGGNHMMMHKYDIGFKATTTIKRSEFGMSYGIPMVSDDVAVEINGEFVQK